MSLWLLRLFARRRGVVYAAANEILSTSQMRNVSEVKENRNMQTKKKTASKREVIQPHQGGTRYVRRNADGTFGKTVDVGRSLSADKRRTAKKKVRKGQGDRGDIAT